VKIALVSIIRNSSFLILSQAISAFFMLVASMIVARLLTPYEIGLFSIAAASTALLIALRNFGTSNFLIQSEALDAQIVNSAFTVTAAISWTMAAILLLARESISDFFNAKEMSLILSILSINFVLSPFIMTGTALLFRAQQIKAVAAIDVASSIFGIATTLVLVALGLGSISLAIGPVATSGLMLLLVRSVKPRGLTYRFSLTHARAVLSFGGWASAITILNQTLSKAPELVLGKTIDVSAAALYDKGSTLPRMIWEHFYGEVLRVLLAACAEEHRNRQSTAELYFSRVAILVSLLSPIFLFISLNSPTLILVVFGDQWAASAPVGTLIAAAGAIISPFAISQPLLVASGRIRSLFLLKLAETVAFLLAFVLLARFGIVMASAAVMISAAVFVYLSQMMMLQLLGSYWRNLWFSLRSAYVVALGAMIPNVVFLMLFGYDASAGTISSLAICGTMTFVTWILLAWGLKMPAGRLLQHLLSRRPLSFT
jgi:O-antigen/teichoic acid export membrane protein